MASEPALAGLAGPKPERADAVHDLFREHWLELVRLATVIVGDVATAEDVVQDAFERLHRGWHRLREPSSGLVYARSSVLNGCRSVHRRAAPRGTNLLAACGRFGRIGVHGFTPLPGSPGEVNGGVYAW